MLYRNAIRRCGLLAAALLFVLAPQMSRAQDSIGTIQRVQGEVSIVRAGKNVKVAVGEAIRRQDQFVTAGDARVLLKLTDNTEIALGENGEAVITEYQFSPGQKGVALVEVKKGAFLFVTGRMSEVANKRIEVKMGLATLTARGTVFWGGPTGGDTQGVAAFHGSVEVKNPQGTVVLTGNGTARVDLSTVVARGRGDLDPTGSTLQPGKAPTAPVTWSQDKVKRATDSVAFR